MDCHFMPPIMPPNVLTAPISTAIYCDRRGGTCRQDGGGVKGTLVVVAHLCFATNRYDQGCCQVCYLLRTFLQLTTQQAGLVGHLVIFPLINRKQLGYFSSLSLISLRRDCISRDCLLMSIASNLFWFMIACNTEPFFESSW